MKDLPSLLDRCRSPISSLKPRQACELLDGFGPLAGWWLQPEVLDLACNHQPAYRPCLKPSLPTSPGSCWVLFRRQGNRPLLRPAFLLPLRWIPGTEHEDVLPLPLRDLAKQVAEQAKQELIEGDWRLALPEGWPVDLGAVDEKLASFESGWASLFGGLFLAARNRCAQPTVWISASWHPEFGIGDVGGLEEKLDLALDFGVEEFFLPAPNYLKGLEWKKSRGSDIDLKPLSQVTKNPSPRALLGEYLARFGLPPAKEDAVERKKEYYLDENPKSEADNFYWNCLFDDVVRNCAESLRSDHPDCRPTHLVTVVSASPSAVALAPAALKVRRCLLLHDKTAKMEGLAAKIADRLTGIDCEPIGIDLGQRESERNQLQAVLAEFFRDVTATNIAFDLTPGFKSLSLALQESAPRGSWLLYCRHNQVSPDYRVEFGTERYDCWQAGTPQS